MLRALVLLLLLANAGFWAWSQGWLAPLNASIGARPEGDREPGRLALQVHPERIQPVALAASAPPVAASAAEPPPVCLEAGPFEPKALAQAQATLQPLLPADSLSVRALGGAWWIVMGPYPEAGQIAKKLAQLRQRGLSAEEARLPAPGASGPALVLSRHDSQTQAETELKALATRKVFTARVLDASAVEPSALRVAQADLALQQQLAALTPEQLGDRRFEPCPSEDTPQGAAAASAVAAGSAPTEPASAPVAASAPAATRAPANSAASAPVNPPARAASAAPPARP
jgi:hypothetical protein